MSASFELKGDYIQLDQLLKATGWVATGGEAHAAVAAGAVKVDGTIESRKRAKLRAGQKVMMGDESVVLVQA